MMDPNVELPWPPLSDYQATAGRLATEQDINACQAAFLLHSKGGARIGQPVTIELPVFAWFIDHDTQQRNRCVLLQAEHADGITYYGGWMIDEKRLIAGFPTDFAIITPIKIA